MNKKPVNKRLIVVLVLSIVLLLVINMFDGSMEGRDLENNTVLMTNDSTIPASIISKATPADENIDSTGVYFKLTSEEIAGLVSEEIVEDSEYSPKRISKGKIQYYTKTVPGTIFSKNIDNSKEEVFFDNKCTDFFINDDMLYALTEEQDLFCCQLDSKQNNKVFYDDTKVLAIFEDKGICYLHTLSGDLYRMEGSSVHKLVHDFGKLYKVINDWIYYYPVKNGAILDTRPEYHGDPGEDIVLKCVRNNGEGEKVVYKSYDYQGWQTDIKLICHDDDWLYYHTIALGGGGSGEGMRNPDFGLFGKMKIGSSEKIEYRDFRMYKPIEKDGYIYYVSIYPLEFSELGHRKEAIKRMNLNTLKHELIMELDDWSECSNFTIFNNCIYYSTKDGDIERVNLDGSDRTKIDLDYPTDHVGSFLKVVFVPGYIRNKDTVKEVLATAYIEENTLPNEKIVFSTIIRVYDKDMNNVLGGKIVNIPKDLGLEHIKSVTVHENILYLKLEDEYLGYSLN